VQHNCNYRIFLKTFNGQDFQYVRVHSKGNVSIPKCEGHEVGCKNCFQISKKKSDMQVKIRHRFQGFSLISNTVNISQISEKNFEKEILVQWRGFGKATSFGNDATLKKTLLIVTSGYAIVCCICIKVYNKNLKPFRRSSHKIFSVEKDGPGVQM